MRMRVGGAAHNYVRGLLNAIINGNLMAVASCTVAVPTWSRDHLYPCVERNRGRSLIYLLAAVLLLAG